VTVRKTVKTFVPITSKNSASGLATLLLMAALLLVLRRRRLARKLTEPKPDKNEPVNEYKVGSKSTR
jgi:uncharacterized protein (TIGR03382 family)